MSTRPNEAYNKLPPSIKARLEKGEPMEYITGKAYFYREEYEVTPDVLIPRPDTEVLVEKLVGLLPDHAHFIDLCCGSGCIAISALCEREDCTAIGYDVSAPAVALAQRNAQRNGVADRYRGQVADVRALSLPACSVIVSNPPYIRTGVLSTLPRSVIDYEPRLALDGGSDGMDFYRVILERFTPGEFFLFEIGYDQGRQIEQLAESFGYRCELFLDYGKRERVALIRR